MNQDYLDTVRLLLDVAPLVLKSPRFAMKGGTALNLFVHDLPRLSVDIDVVFTDHQLDREAALKTIADELAAAKANIEKLGYTAEVKSTKEGDETKLFIANQSTEVKVEVNFVFRGTVMPTVIRFLTPATQELFNLDVRLPILDTPELYGGKLVAAMDRQHPRDFFDVQQMLDKFGLQPVFVDCFVAYLSGHNRPIHEVLFPRRQPQEQAFENEFQGMTRESVSLDSLVATQEHIIQSLPKALTPTHQQFLLSLAKIEPAWELLPFPHLKNLPAIRWKLLNLAKLKKKNPKRFATQFDELDSRFSAE